MKDTLFQLLDVTHSSTTGGLGKSTDGREYLLHMAKAGISQKIADCFCAHPN